jgi:ABC-type antimicrobial peptide transport system permease subunit
MTMNPNLPVLIADALENQQNSPKQTTLRVAASVSGVVGVVGLLLAAVGIYGVTAYAVTRRTREMGIRLALGATRAGVVSMVLRQGMTLVAIGSTIGLFCGAVAAIALSGTIGVPTPDVPMFGGAALLFAAVGLVASYLPVRRAARIGAMDALRYE